MHIMLLPHTIERRIWRIVILCLFLMCMKMREKFLRPQSSLNEWWESPRPNPLIQLSLCHIYIHSLRLTKGQKRTWDICYTRQVEHKCYTYFVYLVSCLYDEKYVFYRYVKDGIRNVSKWINPNPDHYIF